MKLIDSIVSGAHPAKDLHVFVEQFMLMFFCFWPLPVLHSRRCKFIPTTENKLFFRKIRNNVEIEIEKTWFKFVSICVSTLSICIVLVKEWSICIFYWARNLEYFGKLSFLNGREPWLIGTIACWSSTFMNKRSFSCQWQCECLHGKYFMRLETQNKKVFCVVVSNAWCLLCC